MAETIVLQPNIDILKIRTLNNQHIYGTYDTMEDITPKDIYLSMVKNLNYRQDYELDFYNMDTNILYDYDKPIPKSESKIVSLYVKIKSKERELIPNIVEWNDEYLHEKMLEDDDNTRITVLVKTLLGKVINVEVCPNWTVETFKNLLNIKYIHIKPDQQRLVVSGAQMQNTKRLSDYKCTDFSIISMILTLRGGMYHETSGRDGTYQSLDNCIFHIIKYDTLKIDESE